MLHAILLGLAATAAALPLAREEAKENEGVNLPIYKPWYNTYGSNVFGSQYSQYDKDFPNYHFMSEKRFPLDNYDSTNISPFRLNYFSKYMRPEMKYKEFYEYPYMFQGFVNSGYPYKHDMNTFGYESNFMHYPYYNTENFKNTYPSYDGDYSNYMYRPYSPEYMSDYIRNFIHYPYYDMNTNEYMYKPYSHEYKYGNKDNFKNIMFYPYYDKEYAYFNSPKYTNFKTSHNFKNAFYPYYDKEYAYFNSPEFTNFKNSHNFKNAFYPYYDKEYTFFNSPEYTNFKNAFYPYYDKENTYLNSPEYTNTKDSHNFKNAFYPYYDKEYSYFNSPEYTKLKNTFHPFQNYVNKFDYTYRPYSLEYTKGYTENMLYPFYNNMNNYDYKYKPYSTEYMNFKNTYYPFQNDADRFDYTYKPYFPGYPQNFVDKSYPSNIKNGYGYTNMPNYPEYMNFKNMYYPFHENKFDYKYRPYSPEYTYGYTQDSNMRYPFYNKMNGYDYKYRQNYPENKYGFKNTEYPFYNNYYFGRMNYGTDELPEHMGNMRFKRENVENEAADFGTEYQNHDVNVDRPTPRWTRDVDSGFVDMRRQDVLEGEQELTGRQDRTSYVPEQEQHFQAQRNAY